MHLQERHHHQKRSTEKRQNKNTLRYASYDQQTERYMANCSENSENSIYRGTIITPIPSKTHIPYYKITVARADTKLEDIKTPAAENEIIMTNLKDWTLSRESNTARRSENPGDKSYQRTTLWSQERMDDATIELYVSIVSDIDITAITAQLQKTKMMTIYLTHRSGMYRMPKWWTDFKWWMENNIICMPRHCTKNPR